MNLELKHIINYVGHGLEMIFQSKGGRVIYVNGIKKLDSGTVVLSNSYPIWLHSSGFKPILRPLSDLTKKIEVNGKRFIPIVELAKLTHIKEKHIFEISQSVKGECDGVKYSFGFYSGSFWIKKLKGKKWVSHDVFNQMELFEFMYKYKFDIHGLIEKGEAIDINAINND